MTKTIALSLVALTSLAALVSCAHRDNAPTVEVVATPHTVTAEQMPHSYLDMMSGSRIVCPKGSASITNMKNNSSSSTDLVQAVEIESGSIRYFAGVDAKHLNLIYSGEAKFDDMAIASSYLNDASGKPTKARLAVSLADDKAGLTVLDSAHKNLSNTDDSACKVTFKADF